MSRGFQKPMEMHSKNRSAISSIHPCQVIKLNHSNDLRGLIQNNMFSKNK